MSVMPPTPDERLRSLRRFRVFPERAQAIGSAVRSLGREVARLERRLGGAAEAWAAACPERLVGRTAVEGVSRGVMTIRVDDSATRFEIDRWLRAGGERDLVKRCPTAVRKVRVVVGGGEPGMTEQGIRSKARLRPASRRYHSP